MITTSRNFVRTEPLRKAYRQALDGGMSKTDIALGMGWTRNDGFADRRRLDRVLTQGHVSYGNAVKIVRAIGRDPVDFDL